MHFYPCNAPQDRHCDRTGQAFNISFTSECDSISKVSRRSQVGPKLFVNTRYFIHSISLAEERGQYVTGKYVRIWMRVMLVADATIEGLPFQLYTEINIESTRFSAKSTESSSIDHSATTAFRDSLGKYFDCYD